MVMTMHRQNSRVSERPAVRDHPAGEADDAALVAAARRDPAHFAPLYERYFPRIYAYCLRRVDSAQEAEDLTSAIFIKALDGLAAFRGGSVAAWLFTIAHHAVANHYRDRRAHVPLEEAAAILPDEEPAPLEQVLKAEHVTAIRALVADLPQEQRDLLALKLTGGLSAAEIGQVVGKSAGAVRVELHRIIGRLRDRYAQQTGEQGDRA